MTPSSSLFKLIKSLTKSEKRYIKVIAQTHAIGGKNDYITLLDAIDAMNEYNEDQLKKELNNKNTAKYLAANKRYLHKQIIKSLRMFHANNKIEFRINNLTDSGIILYDKGFFSDSLKFFKNAYILAVKSERFPEAMRINVWLRNIALRKLKKYAISHTLIAEQKSLNSKWEKINDLSVFIDENDEATTSILNNRNERDVNAYYKLFRNKFDDGTKKNISFFLTLATQSALLTVSGSIGDKKNAIKHVNCIIRLWKGNSDFILTDPERYYISLSNCITYLNFFELYDRAFECVEMLKRIDSLKLSPLLQMNIQSSYLVFKGETLMYSKKYRLLTVFSKEIETFFYNDSKIIPASRMKELKFILAVCFFYDDRYKKATQLFSYIRSNNKEVRVDLGLMSLLMQIICQYEQGNYDSIEYLLKELEVNKSYRSHSGNFEELFSAFFLNQTLYSSSVNTRKKLFRSFIKKFRQLLYPVEKKKLKNYFDFEDWFNSKREGHLSR